MRVINHYETLDVSKNATKEEIKTAYETKIINARNEIAIQMYKTAYYVLSDDFYRKEYDRTLGIHRYAYESKLSAGGRKVMRVFLTVLDALLTFYWCFLLVVWVYSWCLIYFENQEITFKLVVLFLEEHKVITIILTGIAIVDMSIHYYIRRLNRHLKYYRKEEEYGSR